MKTHGSHYAVIFSSQLSPNAVEYENTAGQILELAKSQPGFIDAESVRDANGRGITVSYWRSLGDIKAWKANSRHIEAQIKGKQVWYESYQIRICRVEHEYGKS